MDDDEFRAADSGSEPEAEEVPKLSEKHRLYKGLIAQWIKEDATKEYSEQTLDRSNGEGIKDDDMTIQELLNKRSEKKIIESPRDYQMELFERAKERNTLAVLDTGSGKTLIAALLIRWILDKELDHRAQGGSRRLMFFIVAGVALAFQQHAVLQFNLDHKIEKLVGSMNVDVYTKQQWNKIFAENMGIVCTADILYQCLSKSFIKMVDINLLIFDEAHHAKKEHAFSIIMREFYHKSHKSHRPRIFGMTASPVDAKVDVYEAATELEVLLDAKIATSRLLTAIRPKEQILPYNKPPKPYSTALCRNLQVTFAEARFLDELMKRAQDLTATLGEWCGDEYLRSCFRESDGPTMENSYKRQGGRSLDPQRIERVNYQMSIISKAREVVSSHEFPLPRNRPGAAVSHKVLSLAKFFNLEFENPTDSKCIVFVGHRLIAFLLVELFKNLDYPHLRCAAMVGTRPPDVGEIAYTLKTQLSTLSKFEKGEYNCLFATTVAEEGIDIADCNIIVRFDLYNTMIQYVQSRGRARHHNSKYIHMLERGNGDHDELFKMAKSSEQKMREFVEKLPADRLLLGAEEELQRLSIKGKDFEVYKDPTTGATLTYRSSQPILHHFLDFLPVRAGEAPPQPTYVVQPRGSGFVCEIIFPDNCPLKSMVGKELPRKGLARRSAAFNACFYLRSKSLLDANLLPTIRRVANTMRNAKLALDEHKGSTYHVRHKPECWSQGWGTIPERLFVTVLRLSESPVNGRDYCPLLLLTRQKITEIPSFPLWPEPDQSVEIACIQLDDCLRLNPERLESLTQFTLRIFKDIYNKEYEYDEAKMSYWIAPCTNKSTYDISSFAESLLDWQALSAANVDEDGTWKPDMPADHSLGRYVVDPGDGSRRFVVEEIATGLTPSHKPPEGVAQMRPRPRFMNSIWDYSNTTWGSKRKPLQEAAEQPVFKAHLFPQRRNIFQQWTDKERETRTLAYICLENFRISNLTLPIVHMAYLLPAIMWRIESHLIAQEACQLLGLSIQPELALEALTKDSDNTEEHRKEQINVRRGMGRNYERLEFLGDCFLKMATTISLFTIKDEDDEFTSHVNRMLMICNKNLFKNAIEIKLYEYIRAGAFSRRLWYPEGLKLLRGKGADRSQEVEAPRQRFSDKTIADVCEAFIGAAFWSYEDSGDMNMAVKAVSKTVGKDAHTMQCWDEYYQKFHKPHWQTAPSTAAHQQLARNIAIRDKYNFRYPRLLQSAFTHPTYPYTWDQIPNYQRLEFLGDALLDMACVKFLYKRYPDRDPQWLTEHKMAIVSNRFLGALAVRLGFNRHLRSNHSKVIGQVKTFCEDIAEAEIKGQGAADYWTHVAKDPPKCLADIVESYIGALFVDSEYCFGEVERFFRDHIAPYFQDMSMYDTFANNHPMVALANMLTETYNCHDFRIMSDEVYAVDGQPTKVVSVAFIHDKIVEGVWSTSTRYGKIKVAQAARKQIEGLAPYEYRLKYGCNCKSKDTSEIEEKLLLTNLGSAV